ncbi:MAG: homoserine dehydrogenase [Gammaproteobacteria bacterium]
MQRIKLGILGLGTVGTGTLNVLQRNYQAICQQVGAELVIKRIAVRDLTKARACNTADIALTDDPLQVVNDPEINIIVELMGGTQLARECVLAAIAQGKHVVTANKALIALHGNEVMAQALKQQVMLAFEAAVAGGIPIIKTMRESLAANQITQIRAILNGTSNYILTEMAEQQREFPQALQQAQALGYAEADPSLDVDGIDVAHKLMILASIAFAIPMHCDALHVEGIRHITQRDIQYAEQLGLAIKHMGIAERYAEGVRLRVHPCLVPRHNLLAHVRGVNNAVMVQGDAVGETLYYGAGAGSEPTASAVLADIIAVAQALRHNHIDPNLHYQVDQSLPLLAMQGLRTGYYLRLMVHDQAGVLADVTQIFGEFNISIESMIQKERAQQASGLVPVIIITHDNVEESALQQAVTRMQLLSSVYEDILVLRLLG